MLCNIWYYGEISVIYIYLIRNYVHKTHEIAHIKMSDYKLWPNYDTR